MVASWTTSRYGLTFTNGDGEVLDLGVPDRIHVLGRTGNFGGTAAEPEFVESLDGSEANVSGVRFTRDEAIVPVRIHPGEGLAVKVQDFIAEVKHKMRALKYNGEANEGYLTFSRNAPWVAASDVWEVPCWPEQPLFEAVANGPIDVPEVNDELRFRLLSRSWTQYPPVADLAVLKAAAAATWTTFTTTLTPGGDDQTYPTWRILGPASGSITSITIENETTERSITLTGFSLVAGQTLVIPTGFRSKVPYVGSSNWFRYVQQLSEFFPLLPTANTITVTKSPTSQSEVQVSYSRRSTALWKG